MPNIIPFQFNSIQVRVVQIDGEPWFIAKDVADVLDYSDAEAMTRRLDDDEKSNLQIVGLGSPNGGRGVLVINESGLYSTILGSTKSEAKQFKKWVTAEVLPSIRKTGRYRVTEVSPSAIQPAKEFRALYGVARLIGCDKNAAAISANQAVTKLTGTDVLALLGQTHLEAEQQELFFTPTELGRRIGVSAKKFNLLLAGAGLQSRVGETWEPMAAAEGFYRLFDTGKRHGSGTPVLQMKWAVNVAELAQAAAREILA